MNCIGFFDQISFDKDKTVFQALAENIDGYFPSTGKTAHVISAEKGLVEMKENSSTPSYLITALKVLSYVTLIIPLIMVTIKAIVRSSYSFQVQIDCPVAFDVKEEPIQERKPPISQSLCMDRAMLIQHASDLLKSSAQVTGIFFLQYISFMLSIVLFHKIKMGKWTFVRSTAVVIHQLSNIFLVPFVQLHKILPKISSGGINVTELFLAAAGEEILFRDFVQKRLLSTLPQKIISKFAPEYSSFIDSKVHKIARVILASIIFGLAHSTFLTNAAGVMPQIGGGLIYGSLIELGWSLKSTTFMHFLWNFGFSQA